MEHPLDQNQNIRQGDFVVEQEKKTIMHLDDARMQVPWLLRFRFEKIRKFDVHKYNLENSSVSSLCVSSNPISVIINEVLDPTFRQSREFAALGPDTKREFEDFVRRRETSQHETFSPVDKVCVQVAVGNHDSGKLQFLQSRQWRSGEDRDYMDELTGPRDWRPTVRRETWEKVREQLQVNFGMDLEGAPCNSVSDMTSILYKRSNNTMESDNPLEAEIKQFKNQNFRLKHENYDLHVKVGSCQEKINEQHIAICDLEKELNTYKTLANLENQKRLFFELEELKQKNKVKEFKIQELQTENDRLKSKYNDLKTKHEAMFAEPPGGRSNSPTTYEEEDKRWNIPSQYHVDKKVQGKIYGAGFR